MHVHTYTCIYFCVFFIHYSNDRLYFRNALDNEISEAESKGKLLESIKTYLQNRVILARESIAIECDKMFREGDTILTFGLSLVVLKVLATLSQEKPLHVIVVDTRFVSFTVLCIHNSIRSS